MTTAKISTWLDSKFQLTNQPGKDLVFALLMLDLKRWGVRMKSTWWWTCPLGACQVAVRNNLWGWTVLARVSRWLLAIPRRLHPLVFDSPVPNFPTVPAQCWYAYFGIPIVLNCEYILLGSLCLVVIKLLVVFVSHCTSACSSRLRIYN